MVSVYSVFVEQDDARNINETLVLEDPAIPHARTSLSCAQRQARSIARNYGISFCRLFASAQGQVQAL